MDLSKIKLVATDCDGVLTDGGMYYLESGDEFKKFNVLDGVGFLQLHEAGIKTAIITTSINSLIERRANKLHVDDLIMGEADKLKSLINLCNKYGFSLLDTVYLGDDINDLPAIRASGIGCVPGNALEYVKLEADYITKRNGGDGCFREISDMIVACMNNNQSLK